MLKIESDHAKHLGGVRAVDGWLLTSPHPGPGFESFYAPQTLNVTDYK
jgi:hypothetical protein